MSITPHRTLQEAIAAVPAVRYAVGITGIAASTAIVASFKLGLAITVLGLVVTLGLMAVLLAFARVAGAEAESRDDALGDGHAVRRAGIVIVWVFTLLTCATGIIVFTVTFFGTPRTWQQLLGPAYAAQGSPSEHRDSSSAIPTTGARSRTSTGVRHVAGKKDSARIRLPTLK